MQIVYEAVANFDYPEVRLSTIIIYVVYFSLMWPIVGLMIKKFKSISEKKQYLISQRLGMANLFLVAGDTAMFICWLLLFINYRWANSLVFHKGMLSIIPLGIVTTSLTMSLYYFYLYYFYKDKFKEGKWTWIGYIILFLLLIRLALHYNPYNVWLNMDPDFSSEPNYTAWIRNLPLFIYGLLIVTLIYIASRNSRMSTSNVESIDSYKKLEYSMLCLYASFVFYGVDIFFSNIIPNSIIWATYTLKTFAYVVAAWFMYKSQAHIG